jgi:hypothetical protein
LTTKSKLKRVKHKAKANPVTTTGSLGAAISIIGAHVGWSAQTQADVATLILLSLPVISFVTSKWFPSLGASATEVVDEVEAEVVAEAVDEVVAEAEAVIESPAEAPAEEAPVDGE